MSNKKKYILAIDQGTTSSRTLLLDENLKIISSSQKEFNQIYPQPSWVEHSPDEIWDTQLYTIQDVIKKSKINPDEILSIGITNQRETIIPFDSETGEPIHNAIVWQCRRTSAFCDELKNKYKEVIKLKTGLEIDAYFSASKMKWIIDNVPSAKELIKNKRLRFGTVDAWILYKLTGQKSFCTDTSNASRTMLFNIKEEKYDKELLEIFGVEEWMLAKVLPSNSEFGFSSKNLIGSEVPIKAILGDQQAALFGQCCFNEGDLKVTYGTGGFLLINIGNEFKLNDNFLTTIAWSLSGLKTTYAYEGATFISGAIIQWLRDGLGIIKDSSEVEKIAISIDSNDGVYLVPALVGLGAPHWDQSARGILIGLTRGTTKAHIVRAGVESMAYQIADLIVPVKDILPKDVFVKADGGAVKNNFLLQFQADLLGTAITRSSQNEATAIGVAMLSGLGEHGLWNSMEDLKKLWKTDELFIPRKNRSQEYVMWKEAVKRSLGWDSK